MDETKYLSGRVTRRTLPALRQPERGHPGLKRLLLPQGELAQFYNGEQPVRYLAYIQLCQGAVRGNHFHHFKEEGLYIIEGEVVLWVQDRESGARESVPLKAGDLAFIPTGIAHAIEVVTAGHAVEFSPARFDPDDTYPFSLVKPGR
jgi:mannose-6-phosphate isomerase-like protein (cupin superfamily)